jgi:hypothetical protein
VRGRKKNGAQEGNETAGPASFYGPVYAKHVGRMNSFLGPRTGGASINRDVRLMDVFLRDFAQEKEAASQNSRLFNASPRVFRSRMTFLP